MVLALPSPQSGAVDDVRSSLRMRSGLRCGDGGRTVDAPSVRSIKGAQPSITLTDQDKLTLRTAAYGAVTLLAAADAAGSPHKVATDGSIALASATGPVGHVLAEKSR